MRRSSGLKLRQLLLVAARMSCKPWNPASAPPCKRDASLVRSTRCSCWRASHASSCCDSHEDRRDDALAMVDAKPAASQRARTSRSHAYGIMHCFGCRGVFAGRFPVNPQWTPSGPPSGPPLDPVNGRGIFLGIVCKSITSMIDLEKPKYNKFFSL